MISSKMCLLCKTQEKKAKIPEIFSSNIKIFQRCGTFLHTFAINKHVKTEKLEKKMHCIDYFSGKKYIFPKKKREKLEERTLRLGVRT